MARDTVPGLALRLKQAREAAGLTQIEAGERAGVHHISIAKFETEVATPTVRVLIKLAAAYGVTTCDLIPEKPAKPRPRRKK